MMSDPVWRVEVEERRSHTVWVQAATRREAEVDAEDLYGDQPPDDVEIDSSGREESPQPGQEVWVGGDSGDWVTWP